MGTRSADEPCSGAGRLIWAARWRLAVQIHRVLDFYFDLDGSSPPILWCRFPADRRRPANCFRTTCRRPSWTLVALPGPRAPAELPRRRWRMSEGTLLRLRHRFLFRRRTYSGVPVSSEHHRRLRRSHQAVARWRRCGFSTGRRGPRCRDFEESLHRSVATAGYTR